ncbi:MAG: hypothetical protein SGBAC_009883 [Bacillariaceae sp.]
MIGLSPKRTVAGLILLNLSVALNTGVCVSLPFEEETHCNLQRRHGIMQETFHRAISLYVAARRTKKGKYKKHAKKIHKTIRNWKKEGVPNVVYYCIFLDAEKAALAGKHEEAETQYQKAIQFVGRSGYLHHAALFNELYSDFLLREKKNEDEARYRLGEAIRYYDDWGAGGVVARLKKSSLFGVEP